MSLTSFLFGGLCGGLAMLVSLFLTFLYAEFKSLNGLDRSDRSDLHERCQFLWIFIFGPLSFLFGFALGLFLSF